MNTFEPLNPNAMSTIRVPQSSGFFLLVAISVALS